MNTKRFLKSILTSTAMIAAASAPIYSASAVVTDTGGNETLTAVGTWNGGIILTGESIRLTGTHNLTFNSAGFNVLALDLNDVNAAAANTISVANNVTLGAVALDGANAGTPARAIPLNFTGDNVTLTLTGTADGAVVANNYAGLGTIDLNNKTAAVVTIASTVTGSTTLPAIDNTGAAAGTVNVIGTGNTIGAVGATSALDAVNITAATGTTTFSGVLNADVVSHTGAGALVVTGAVATNTKSFTTTGGAATFNGAVTTTGADLAAVGDTAFETGAALTTFAGGTATIGGTKGVLKIGAGGITSDQHVVLGNVANTDAVAATAGKLTFTDTKTLTLNGNYNATGGIHVDNGTAKTLTVVGSTPRNVESGFTTLAAQTNKHTLNFTSGAAGVITQNADIGASDATWLDVQIDGQHSSLDLAAGKKIYATHVSLNNHANATLTLNEGSDVVGTIRATDGHGALVIKGDSGSTSTKLDFVGANRLAAITFDVSGANKTFTSSAGNGTTKVGIVTFNGAAGDQSNLLLDMTSLVAGNNVNLDLTGVTVANAGSVGKITFKKGAAAATAQITVGGGHIGTAANKLGVIDATGVDLTLTGGGNNVFANSILANNLTLDKTTLGVYTRTTGSPSKYIVKNNDSTIATGSTISTAANTAVIDFPDGVDRTLTLANGVDHHGSITATGNFGILSLAQENNLNLTSLGASGASLTRIDIAHNGTSTNTITSTGDIYADEIRITQNNDPVLVLNGNLKGSLRSTTDNKGVYTLQGNTTIDGSIDGVTPTQSVGTVNIDTTGTVTVGAATAGSHYEATNTIFVQDGTLKLSDKVTTMGATIVTTTGSSGTGTLEINTDYDNLGPAGLIGTSAKKLKKVIIGSDKTLTANGAVHANTIATTTDNKGAVDFSVAADLTGTSVGEAAKKMKLVTVTNSTTLDDVFSKDVTIVDGQNLTAKNVTSTNAIQTNTTGGIILLDGGSITTPSGTASTTGTGIVTANGAATISGDLAGGLTLAGGNVDKVVTFNGSAITGNVIGDTSTLALGGAAGTTTFKGTLVTTGTTLDLGARQLNVTGTTTFNGANVIKLGSTADGAIRSDNAAPFTLAGAGTLTLDFSNTATAASSLKLFTKLDGTTAAAVTNLTDGTAITAQNARTIKSIAYDGTNNVFTVTRKSGAELGTALLNANASASSLLDKISKASSFAGDEVAFVSALNSATTDAAAEELVLNLVPQTLESVGDVNTAARSAAGTAYNSRLAETGATFASSSAGVAAGDAADRFGLWADVKMGKAEQKERKSIAGYKSNSYGAFVGVDTMLSDRSTLGVAFGYDHQNLKHKDSQDGSKTKAGSLSFGAYGNYDFGNNFFAQGNATVAQTTIDAKVRRGTTGNYTTAKGKYDVLGYSAEARGGYRFKLDNSTITPTAGLRYSYFGDASFAEKGAAYNLDMKGKSRSNLAAVAGLNLGAALDLDGVDVRPEVHMNFAYDVVAPKQKASYSFVGGNMKINYTGAKPSRFAYNFGASVMAKTDNIEYGVGYDADIADKYLGHTGSVKVKVSF